MKTLRRQQKTYDPRLRELVREAGDPGIVAGLGIPRSTVSGWLRRDSQPVISIRYMHLTPQALDNAISKLEEPAPWGPNPRTEPTKNPKIHAGKLQKRMSQ